MQSAGRRQRNIDDLVICKPNGAPQAANWISTGFGKLLAGLDMPHIRYHDLRHTAATNMHQLTGDFYTVGEVLDAYHAAVHPQPKQARQTTPKQDKQTSKRKSPEMML